MEKLTLITTMLLILFSLFNQNISAIQVPTSPLCEIEAEVLDTKWPNKVDLHVIFVGKMIETGYSPEWTCERLYENKSLEKVYVVNTRLKSGQKIKGHIQYGGDERGTGYSIENIRILEDVVQDQSEINYIYYVAPVLIILFIIVLYLIFKKRKSL